MEAIILKLKHLFLRFHATFTHNDIEREMYLWQIFRRFDAIIGIVIGMAVAIIMNCWLLPILYFQHPASSEKGALNLLFLEAAKGCVIAALFGAFIVSQQYVTDKFGKRGFKKKDDLHAGHLLYSSIIARFFFVIMILAPFHSVYICLKHGQFLLAGAGLVSLLVVMPIVLIIMESNAREYTIWRMKWAYQHYDSLLSRYTRFHTSDMDLNTDRQNLKYSVSYKKVLSIIFLCLPTINCSSLLTHAAIHAKTTSNTKESLSQSVPASVETDNQIIDNMEINDTSNTVPEVEQQELSELSSNDTTDNAIDDDFQNVGESPLFSGTLKMMGIIGSHHVAGTLHFNDDNFTGVYRNDDDKPTLTLSGRLIGDKKIEIDEYTPKGDHSGHFDGNIVDENHISGTFTNSKGEMFNFKWELGNPSFE